MKNLTCAVVAVLAIGSSTVRAESINEDVGQMKLDDIKANDLPGGERHLKKFFGKDVAFTVEWDSFKKASISTAEELGADIQSVLRATHDLAEDDAIKAKFASTIDKINIKHDAKAAMPSFTCKKKELLLTGNFTQMNWNKTGKGIKTMITECLK